MARQQRIQAIFFAILITSTRFTSALPANFIDNFKEKVEASIGGILREAELTRPRNSWNFLAQLNWRRTYMTALVKDFLKNFVALGDGFEDGNNVRLQMIDILKNPESETHEKWFVEGTKIFTGAFKEEIREEQTKLDITQDKPSVRGHRHIRDSVSYDDPRMTALLNYVQHQIDPTSEIGTTFTNSIRKRRSMTQMTAALSLGYANIGGFGGVVVLALRTTAFNILMAYFYACYQLFSARLTQVVDSSRKRLLSELECQAAVAAGQGSLPENLGCKELLKGEPLLAFLKQMEHKYSKQNMTLDQQDPISTANQTPSDKNNNNFQKRAQLVDLTPMDDEMSFDAKAVADYLKQWAEDPSRRIEVMDLKAIRDLYDWSKDYHIPSSNVNLAYKEKLIYYCHFAAEADRRQGVLSTCPFR